MRQQTKRAGSTFVIAGLDPAIQLLPPGVKDRPLDARVNAGMTKVALQLCPDNAYSIVPEV